MFDAVDDDDGDRAECAGEESTAGGAMTYIGRKAGVDRVKFIFGKSVCSGTSDFNIVVSGRTAYYSTDTLGSVTELSSAAGTSLGRFDRGPFGEAETATGVSPSAAGDPFACTGEYRDPATGLYNLRARNYDSATGRFLAPDPLGPQDSASTYAYVANNPLGYVDPSGMKRGTCGSIGCFAGADVDGVSTVLGVVGLAGYGSCAVGFVLGCAIGSVASVLSTSASVVNAVYVCKDNHRRECLNAGFSATVSLAAAGTASKLVKYEFSTLPGRRAMFADEWATKQFGKGKAWGAAAAWGAGFATQQLLGGR